MNNYQFPFPTPWEVELNCSRICDGSFPGTNVSIKGTAQPNQLCSSDTVWLNISTEISVLPKMAPRGTRCALKTQSRMPTNLLSTRSIRTVLAWTVLLGKFKAWVQVQLTELTGHWTIKLPLPTGTKTAVSTLEVRRSLLNWVSPMRSSQKRRTFLSSIQPQQDPLEKNRFTTPFPQKVDHAIDHKLIAAEKDVDAEEIVEFSVHPQYNIAC